MKYWAFISYSHRDEAWARWLHRAIETYRVPGRLVGKTTRDGSVPERLFPVFRDRAELAAAPDLSSSIVEALKQSRFLIVICSRTAATSRWVNEEVRTFKALGGSGRVLCLVVDGEPNASDTAALALHECFPPAVRYCVNSDGVVLHERAEPLAADARPGKDGRTAAKLKLLAALLDVGLDDLTLREQERKRAAQRVSLVFAAVFAALLLLPNGPLPPLRTWIFDQFQVHMPRNPTAAPVATVEFDDRSLASLGQWPLPRKLLAQLVDKVSREQPAAIALNIWMPEPDRFSATDGSFGGSTSNDSELARAIAESSTVLAVVGDPESGGQPIRASLFRVRDSQVPSNPAGRGALQLSRHNGVSSSIAVLDRAAAGRGLISLPLSSDGVVRQIPLVSSVNETLVPALAIEMLRVALHAPSFVLFTSGNSVQSVAIGDLVIPTDEQGAVRLHYSTGTLANSASAIDVLNGKFDSGLLRGKLVLIGVTAAGTEGTHVVPGGRLMRGTDIHRELLENIFEGSLLSRPGWVMYVEALVFVMLAILFTIGVPRWPAAFSVLAVIVCCGIITITSVSMFYWQRILLDPAHIVLGVVVSVAVIIGYGFFSTRT